MFVLLLIKSQHQKGGLVRKYLWIFRRQNLKQSRNDFSHSSITLDSQESSACKFSSQFQRNVGQIGIENEDNYQLNRYDVDIVPNSHDYPRNKFMLPVRRMNVLVLGMKGRKLIYRFFFVGF